MSPEEFSVLQNRISKESISSLLSDPSFLSAGSKLVSEVRRTSISDLPAHRTELYVALHFVSFVEDLDAALKWINELARAGLSGPICAIAASQVCRRLGNYAKACSSLRRVYYLSGESSYVSYFYAQSLAAMGDFLGLEGLSEECLPMIERASATRDSNRWATLLLDMGLAESAKVYIDVLPESTEKKFLASRLSTYSEGSVFDLPMKVVNLDSDTRKWRVASGALTRAGYTSIERHSAVSGRRLPVAVMKRLVAEPDVYSSIGAGAVGCWLSHYAIWESVAQGDQDWTLVAEDDAAPFVHSSFLSSSWKELSTFDLVWINDRMSGIYHQSEKIWSPSLLDNWEQLKSWPEHRQGWGTDGYLLSRRGAEQLLDLVDQTGIVSHIDGQMGAWSTLPSTGGENRIQREILGLRSKSSMEGAINSTCLNIPAIKHNHFGVSATASLKRDR